MLIKTLPVGHLDTNCYIVTDENSLECAVIDPGAEANTILDYIEDNSLKCKAVFLTHGHFDHTGAVEDVAEDTGATVYMNELDDARVAQDQHFPFSLPQGGVFYSDGDVIEVGALRFEVIATPGHTKGGVTLKCEDALFTGDTLFRGSCGRADLYGGDFDEELRSLQLLCSLPGDYEVYPGHMDATTLERERNFNYYCRTAMQS